MEIYELVTQAMVVAIVLINISTLYDSAVQFRIHHNWLDLLISIVVAIWIGFYVYVLFAEPRESAKVGQTVVRPLLVVTFLILNTLEKLSAIKRGKICRQ